MIHGPSGGVTSSGCWRRASPHGAVGAAPVLSGGGLIERPPTAGEVVADSGHQADFVVIGVTAALGAELELEQVRKPFLGRLVHRSGLR